MMMVVHYSVAVSVMMLGRHGGLEISPLRVLALALVGVLVSAKSLRGGEVSAAVVALELASGFGSGGDICVRVLGGDFVFCNVRLVRELDAEEADSAGGRGAARALSSWRRGPDEGELGEGVHVHEVFGLPLAHLSEDLEKTTAALPAPLVLVERERGEKTGR